MFETYFYVSSAVTIKQSSSNPYATHRRIVWVSQRWLIMTFLVGHKVIMVVIGYAFHITISLYLYVMFETYFYVSSTVTISQSSTNLYAKITQTILWVNHSFKVCISVVHIISFLFAVDCCVCIFEYLWYQRNHMHCLILFLPQSYATSSSYVVHKRLIVVCMFAIL